MSCEIYYFSGTGNSLFIAKRLASELENRGWHTPRLLPMVAYLASDRPGPLRSSADRIGFVFPIHALTIPMAVNIFLKNFHPKPEAYTFAVATRHGTKFYGFSKIHRRLKRRGSGLMASAIVSMGNNEARQQVYARPSDHELAELELRAISQLQRATDMFAEEKTGALEDGGDFIDFPFSPLVNKLMTSIILGAMNLSELIGGPQYFYVDEKCIGCGVCQRVCLSGKITLAGAGAQAKPRWEKNIMCYMCYACLNFCPTQAIQIADIPGVPSLTATNDRYPHPYATIEDLEKQKIVAENS